MISKKLKYKNNQKEVVHVPVMLQEAISSLKINKAGVYVDGTGGSGGHAFEIASRLEGTGVLYVVDWDEVALGRCKEKLARFSNIKFLKANFAGLELGVDLDGVLLDLGISSNQILDETRGISFKNPEAGLDMRLDSGMDTTAADILNNYSQEELEQIFYDFGEERRGHGIVKKLLEYRKKARFKTVGDLLDCLVFLRRPNQRTHYATGVFRVLRMAVNDELGNIEKAIHNFFRQLKPLCRLVIISFHSTEDRVVKNIFREYKKKGLAKVITKKPLVPDYEEIKRNPRARSAKLRVLEKLA